MLERLGYRFIRIRGSDYYRRREKTVEDLYKRLDELKVSKGNSETSKKYNNKDIDSNLLLEAEKIRLKIEAKLKQDGKKEAYPRPFKGGWDRSRRTVVAHTSSERATINYPDRIDERQQETSENKIEKTEKDIEKPLDFIKNRKLPNENKLVDSHEIKNKKKSNKLNSSITTESKITKLIKNIDGEVWFKASQIERFSSFFKRLSYSLAKCKKSNVEPSEKQSYWGLKILKALPKKEFEKYKIPSLSIIYKMIRKYSERFEN